MAAVARVLWQRLRLHQLQVCSLRIGQPVMLKADVYGKKVEYQAQRKWNPLTSRFDWDAGSC